ncbi:oxygenase MpaB family protein [Novosphingobium sp. JCM 18896]|uniref:oxygenase MpaB family protein n=1 Tax=Novosphingobium sp. JCM 18896 TaxID=2989731 RepID=UPI0039B5268D
MLDGGEITRPRSRTEVLQRIGAMRSQLRADARSREVAALILRRPRPSLDGVPLALVQHAAVDLLPGWARRLHRLTGSGPARSLVAGGTLTLARTLRWAFS